MQKGAITSLGVMILLSLGCPGVNFPDNGDPSNRAIDIQLRSILETGSVEALIKPDTNPAKVTLGQALFFDKILSGNRDISCSTCHTPMAFTGDGLSLAIGQGGSGLSMSRTAPTDANGSEMFIPRNSPELFNRAGLTNIFWDGRITTNLDGSFLTPAGDQLPATGFDRVLAAQAMFPVTSPEEMRGFPGDNELANIANDDFQGIWSALMNRLLAIEEYRTLFTAAYPEIESSALSFVHAANSIAEFEIEHWTLTDSPFDRYLGGDNDALSVSAKRGALLFYGEAGCSVCHSGTLLTDESFHNRVVPQLGPGQGDGIDGLSDFGRERVTADVADRYKFRTAPLRNVSMTGPWMHSGAFIRLEDVVRHELDPVASAMSYIADDLRPDFAATYHPEQTVAIVGAMDANETVPVLLTDSEIADMVIFLESLTSPRVSTLASRNTPDRVPSGLPLAD